MPTPLNLTLDGWNKAWRQVAVQAFVDIIEATRDEDAVNAARVAWSLRAARDELAAAIAGDNKALYKALNPVDPYEDLKK